MKNLEIKKKFENVFTNVEVTFRYYQKEYYEGFAQCITEFYGDSYPHDEYLQKRYIETMIAQHKMLIICGIIDTGEIVSVSGASLDCGFDHSSLLTLRTVKKRFRRMGIGDFQENLLLDAVEQCKEIDSIYVELMQNNGSSQKNLEKKGFVNTGIRIGQYGDEKLLEALHTNVKKRTSAVVMCKNLNVKDAGILYYPEELISFAEMIYQKLQTKVEIVHETLKPKVDLSKIKIQKHFPNGSVNLMIDVIGSEFENELAEILSDDKNSSFVCYLNVKDNAVCLAYYVLKNYGFFFSGMKPLNGGKEYMMLAKVDVNILDMDHFTPDSPGEKMFHQLLQMK